MLRVITRWLTEVLSDWVGRMGRSLSKWRANPLGLGRDDLLVEQLKLIYASMSLSLGPMFPGMVLLVIVLNDGSNLSALLLWFLGLGANNVQLMVDSRRRLRVGIAPGQARALVWRLLLSIGIGGFAWGALAFGALGHASLGGNVLVVGVLAGILGGAVSLLSPVPVVFAALALSLVGTTVARLWQINDPAFNAFGIISLMYMAVLIVQCRNASKTVNAAIGLRFENLDLAQRAETARLDAVQANVAKSRFLAAASHDLRQPIHAQGLFLEVLANTALTRQQKDLLDSVRLSRDSAAEMLDVLLDFSRIEAGVIEPQIEAFRMQPLLNRLEREFGPQADSKHLVYRCRESTLLVESDAALLELILRNLISNAIRYTETGGILVTCRRRGASALIEVRDTGIGIAPDQHAEVFREFRQLANPERDSRKGLGLGLAIAQGMARTLGASLALCSKPGRGSVFGLVLPLTTHLSVTTHLPVKATLTARNQVHGWELSGLRVLLIDDDPSVRLGMSHLLGSWGCECVAAESIEQALESLSGFGAQVAICDYRLREQRTGAEAVVALRARLGQAFACIIITGDTAPERLREAKATGVPLLHKPVNPQRLLEALLSATAGQAAVVRQPR